MTDDEITPQLPEPSDLIHRINISSTTDPASQFIKFASATANRSSFNTMPSSPVPEFDTFIHNFIASHARTIFAGVPPSESQPLVFTVHTNFLGNLAKEGPLPASKSAIEVLPTVSVTEEEEESDCAICLTEYGVAGEVKELPCKHRYHSDCIVKWLGIHGSCPVCRYEMPVDEEEEKRRRDGGVGWQVVITVTSDAPANETGLDSVESNGQSIEDMDIDQDSSMEELD